MHIILGNADECSVTESHRVGGNRKRYQQSTNADQRSKEIVLSVAICHQWSDKWQSKTLFLLIFDLRSSIVLAFSIAAYPVLKWITHELARMNAYWCLIKPNLMFFTL